MTSREPDRGEGRAAVLVPAGDTGATAVLESAEPVSKLATAWRAILRPLIPVVVAMLVWALSLSQIDIRDMTDLGLVSVLPLSVYVALGILTVSFCVTVRRPQTHWLVLALHVIALIVIIHGTPAILYGTLRYSWAWKHVGVVDYIQRHGSVDPHISVLQANHLWPGFFALNALVTDIAGFRSALSFASWAPVFFNLLFAGALLFIFRSLTVDRRHVWFAVWIFVATNWVGQDYFSPQAMNYFLYLVIIGVCIRWFRPFASPIALDRLVQAVDTNGGPGGRASMGERITQWLVPDRANALFRRIVASGAADPRAMDPERRRQRPALLMIVIALSAVIVVSHQLTPFMLIFALGALSVFYVCTARSLPLLVIVFTAAWTAYMGVGFLHGNGYWIVESIGKLNVGSSTLASLTRASPDQVFVIYMSRGLSALVVGLAAVGFARRFRSGRLDLPVVLLALAPALMIWGNAYGGEILFRVFLFSLPFLVFLAAAVVYPTLRSGKSRATPLLAAGISAVLLAGLVIVYYGKERAYHFSKDEVAAANYLFTKAPPGSLFVDGTENYPWAFRDYERYRYVQIALQPAQDRVRILQDPAAGVKRLVAENGGGRAYVIITRSQEADTEMTGMLLANSLQRVSRALTSSPGYRVVYRGPDAVIFAMPPVEAAS